jgi:hypothetical protein
VLPLSPGRAERHGFEYYRHGTLSLYAAAGRQDGKGAGHDLGATREPGFRCVFGRLGETYGMGPGNPRRAGQFVGAQNQSGRAISRAAPARAVHFTPTYSSWLNQVELWFAKIQRDVIARGVFTSVADLGIKLRKYIRNYAKTARPFRWTYTDPKRRIPINKIAGTAY